MNFKKIVIATASVALMLGATIPAFASERSSGVSVSNSGNIRSSVRTAANTGLNQVSGGQSGEHHSSNGGSVVTGNASAASDVLNSIATSSNCGCNTGGEHNSGNVSVSNSGNIRSSVRTAANTGLNQVSGGGSVNTGDAGAGAVVTNVVNTSVGAAN